MPFFKRWSNFAIAIFVVLVNSANAQETISFTVTNGPEIRCAADSTVSITISPNMSDAFTEINLIWGDGGAIETILPGESLDRTHTFSNYPFLDEDVCAYTCAVNPLINGFCYNISIIATYENIPDENNAKLITYKIPPRVEFSPDNSIICEGDEICFSNATCPNNDEDMVYTWDFGNGNTTTSQDTCIVYLNEGNYSVTLTATNSCGSDTEIQTIQVLGLPTADVSFESDIGTQDTMACLPYGLHFNNQSINGTAYHWEVFFENNIVFDTISANPIPLDYIFTMAGTYTVRLTTSSTCGEVIWEQVFLIGEPPSITLQTPDPACESLSYTPVVSYEGGQIDDFSWTFQGGNPSSSNEEFPTDILFNTPGLHPITVDVTSFCGVETASTFVEIQSPEIIQIGTIDSPFCNSLDTILLAASPIGGQWSGAGVLNDSLFISNLAGEGLHQLSYTFGAGVCESTDSITIEVLPLAEVDAGNDLAFCIDDTIHTLQGFTPANGQWSGTGIVSNSPPNFDPAIANVGTHELTYTFEDADGCFSFDIIEADVEALPIVNLPDTLLVCNIAATIDLSSLANSMPTPAGGTAFWSGPGIIDNNSGTFISPGMGNYTIIYTYTTASVAACTVVDSLIVQVIEPTEVVAQPDATVCISEATYLLDVSPSNTGNWTGPGLIDASTGEIDLVAAMGGVHSYQYTIFEGTSCEMSDEVLIEILDFAGVEAGMDEIVCENEVSIQLSGNDNNSGEWSGIPSIDEQGLVTIAPLDTGVYTIYYTQSNQAFNCAQTDSLLLTVVALPDIAFSVDSACINVAAQFMNETLGASSYVWNFGNNNISTQENPNHTFTTFGDFPVSLTAFTDNNICENTLTQIIHISQPPELVAFAPVFQDSCAALDVTLNNGSIGENLDFIWYQGDQIISQEDGPIQLTLASGRTDTTYYFRLEVANGCGGENAIDSVHVSPLPVAFFGVNQNNFCSGEMVDLINISYGNPQAYLWDFGDPSIPTSTDSIPPPVFYLADSTINRTISLITSNECGTDTLTHDILIHPTEVEAFFNTPDNTVCVGDSICFTNFSTFGADLVYDFGDGNSSTDTHPCHVYQQAGTYVVELMATACGFDQTVRTVTVLPAPELHFSAPPFVCENAAVSIIDSSINVSQYAWDFGDSLSATLTHPSHLYDSVGMYTITLRGTSANGCSSTLSHPVEVVGLPEALFSTQDSLCSGETFVFDNLSINAASCFWDFGDQNFASDCNTSHLYALGDTTYFPTLISTNSAGCMDTFVQAIYIRATPIPDFEFTNACSPATIPFSNLSQNADSYQWTFSNGATSTNTHPEIFFDGTIFTASLLAINDGICTAEIEKELLLHERPNAAFTPSTTAVCANSEVVFNNQSTGDITSQRWVFGSPDGIVSFDESPQYFIENDGILEVELVVNTAFCSDTTTQELTVFEAISASFQTNDLICFEQATGSIETNIDAGTAPFQYDWSNGGLGAGISGLAAGQYTLNITDDNACHLQANFTIEQPDPIMVELLEAIVVGCYGESNGGLTVAAQGGVPDYEYQWAIGQTGASIINLPAGDYTLTVTDANGCLASLSFPITQNDPISIVEQVSNISCHGFGDGEIFIDSIMGGSPIFNLTLTGPVNYQQVNRRFGELLAGAYQLTLVDAEGCTATYHYSIEEPDSIFVDILQEDTTIVLGEYVDLTANFNAVNPVFVWNPDENLDCKDCFNPESQPHRNVTYQVVMTDQNDCSVSDQVSIKVLQTKDVFIPNAFTPNGDGHNDVFRVRSLAKSIVNIQEFTVVDRWGQILFQAKDYQLNDIVGEWTGEGKDGNKASPGVYTWYAIINYVDGKTDHLKGDITLIR